MFRKREPKYNVGDIVRFYDGCYVFSGRIWKIHTCWLSKPHYKIFEEWEMSGRGCNYEVPETNIIELLKKGEGSANNPFAPHNKKI